MGRHRGAQPAVLGADKIDGVSRGDVLQHHFEGREVGEQGRQGALDKDRLAVEDVDVRVGRLAWTRSGIPISCMHSKTAVTRPRAVTPWAEWVVEWAG